MRRLAGILFMLFVLAVPVLAQGPDDVPRITVQELKASIEKNEAVTVVDVRSRGSFERSDVKIKGAVRIAPNELNERASELPSGRDLIFYCS